MQEKVSREQHEVTEATRRILSKAIIAFIKKYPQIQGLSWDQFAGNPDGNGPERIEIKKYTVTIRREDFVGHYIQDLFSPDPIDWIDVDIDERPISDLKDLHPPMYKDLQELFTYIFELQPALSQIYGNITHVYATRENFESMESTDKNRSDFYLDYKITLEFLYKGLKKWIARKLKNIKWKKIVTSLFPVSILTGLGLSTEKSSKRTKNTM